VPAAPHAEDEAALWARLVRYHRACVARESGFAELLQRASNGGQYVLLSGGPEPLLSDDEGVVRVDDRVRSLATRAATRGNALCYGYPVLVFHDGGANGSAVRRKLAPLLVHELVLPNSGLPVPDALRPRTDRPFLYGAAMSRLGFKEEQQTLLLERAAPDEWIGDASRVAEHVVALLEDLGVSAVEEMDPRALCRVAEGQIDGVGAHNVGIVFRTSRAVYYARLLEELRLLESAWRDARRSAAAFLLGPPSPQPVTPNARARSRGEQAASPPPVQLAAPIPLNDAQRAALKSAMEAPLTVVTGPPGTGKSQLVTSIVASAWLSGQSVLVASTNNQAVDVACARAQGLWPGLVVRTGSRDYREASRELLLGLLERSAAIPDLTALRTHFAAVASRHTAVVAAIDERSATEERLMSVELGRELLAAACGEKSTALIASGTNNELLRLERTLRRIADERGPFLRWRTRRASKRLGLDAASRVAEVRHLIALELERRQAASAIESQGSFEGLWRALRDAEADLQQASADLTRATAQDRFRTGSSVIRRFAVAQARYGAAGGPSDVLPDVLPYARAWATTALSAGATIPLRAGLFDVVVVDEASQCSIAAILPLLYRAQRAVIIGDPMQLSHITGMSRTEDDERMKSAGLDPASVRAMRLSYGADSVFRALEKATEQVQLLDEHYRSHPDIINVANRLFYHGDLRVLTDPRRLVASDLPVLSWRDTRGRAVRPESGSAYNAAEVAEVRAIVQDIAARPGWSGSIGVVTPFSLQARHIEEVLEAAMTDAERRRIKLVVGTAHRFQGDERDVIVFSTVLSEGLPDSSAKWLLGTPNLFNVAVTRARSALVVVGNRAMCAGHGGLLAELVKSVQELETRDRVSLAASRGDLHSEPERRLYEAMCRAGLNPEPKVRVGGYEADFVVRRGSTIVNIECDGRHHINSAGRLRRQDRARDALIEALGFTVHRVPAWQCLRDPEGIVQQVVCHLGVDTEMDTKTAQD